MNLNAAAYWIVAGVLAFGLSSEYRQGRFGPLRQAADRAAAVLCQAAARAEGAIGSATLSARDWSASWDAAHAHTEAARARAEFVRGQIIAQGNILRAQAEMRRAGMEQLRWHVQSEANFANGGHRIAMICPKTGARIVVRAGSDLGGDMASVAVSDSF